MLLRNISWIIWYFSLAPVTFSPFLNSKKKSPMCNGVFLLISIFCFVCSPQALAKLDPGMKSLKATGVIGQPNFSTTVAAATASGLSLPIGIEAYRDLLFISDRGNNRVMIYKRNEDSVYLPFIVLGQPNFDSNALNNGGIGAATLSAPDGVFYDGQKLYVADLGNSRVLIWNSLPRSNFAPADVVVGQPDFVTNGSATTRFKAANPTGVIIAQGKLIFSDFSNHRVLIYNKIPTTNSAPADVVIGQSDFDTATVGTSRTKFLANPGRLTFDGKRLFIPDSGGNRVMVYNSIPTQNNAPADLVLGQPDFDDSSLGTSSSDMRVPRYALSDGKRLFVSDGDNNRLLIWNQIPKKNGQPADIVVDSFLGPSGSPISFTTPHGLLFNGKELFVTDSFNNRVLIFNIGESSVAKLGPQFEQGKGVLGKVFWDWNGNGIQDPSAGSGQASSSPEASQNDRESGIEGVKVVSDTGIYAITDEDGKYHFPYIETGQRVLKIDKDTLPEDAEITTDNPYKVVVTEGVLTKVSFGVKQRAGGMEHGEGHGTRDLGQGKSNIVLKVSVAQESSQLKPRLGVTVEMGKDKQEGKLVFTIDCNYFLFIKRSELKIYDQDQKLVKTIELPQPVPLYYELNPQEIAPLLREEKNQSLFYYQVSVYGKQGAEDRTSVGAYQIVST